MINILEIPVIGSRDSEKEKIYSLCSDQALRKFEGMDFGFLKFDGDLSIYFYFLDQEDDNYLYLWDLLIPHAIGCLVVCDFDRSDIFKKNVEIIENIENRYQTPLHICALPSESEIPGEIEKKELSGEEKRKVLKFDPNDKTSARDILLAILGEVSTSSP